MFKVAVLLFKSGTATGILSDLCDNSSFLFRKSGIGRKPSGEIRWSGESGGVYFHSPGPEALARVWLLHGLATYVGARCG